MHTLTAFVTRFRSLRRSPACLDFGVPIGTIDRHGLEQFALEPSSGGGTARG